MLGCGITLETNRCGSTSVLFTCLYFVSPVSAWAEGSSIVDGPGECSTPVRENQRREPGGFLREKLISDHGLFSSYEGQQGAANRQDSRGVFQGCTGLWPAGCWLARRLHQLKTSTTMDLGVSIFPYFFMMRAALRDLGLLIKTDWLSVICPLCC